MASDISSGITVYDSTLSSGMKEIVVITAATADDSDYFSLNLWDYGIKTILTQFAVCHTTAVSSGVLTVTLGAVGGTDKKRVVTIRGLC